MTSDIVDFASDPRRRLDEVERLLARHGTSVSELVTVTGALTRRVEHLEAQAQARAITEAREDERDKALYDRLDRMETSIKTVDGKVEGLRGGVSKAVWIFGAAIITAFAAWLIKGGMA